MIKVADYLQLGYRGIVFLSVKDWEEKSGYQDEHTVQTLACFDKDGNPLKLVFHWVEKFSPKSARQEHFIESKEAISQTDYEALVKEYGVQDDPLYYQNQAKKESKRRAARVKLDAMIPKCPACGTQMTLKINRNTRSPFWGCSGFSRGRCSATRSMSSKEYQSFDRLSKVANQL